MFSRVPMDTLEGIGSDGWIGDLYPSNFNEGTLPNLPAGIAPVGTVPLKKGLLRRWFL